VRASIPKPRPAPEYIWEDLLRNAKPRERVIALLAGVAGPRRDRGRALRRHLPRRAWLVVDRAR
jgi:hypothetical protein